MGWSSADPRHSRTVELPAHPTRGAQRDGVGTEDAAFEANRQSADRRFVGETRRIAGSRRCQARVTPPPITTVVTSIKAATIVMACPIAVPAASNTAAAVESPLPASTAMSAADRVIPVPSR